MFKGDIKLPARLGEDERFDRAGKLPCECYWRRAVVMGEFMVGLAELCSNRRLGLAR